MAAFPERILKVSEFGSRCFRQKVVENKTELKESKWAQTERWVLYPCLLSSRTPQPQLAVCETRIVSRPSHYKPSDTNTTLLVFVSLWLDAWLWLAGGGAWNSGYSLESRFIHHSRAGVQVMAPNLCGVTRYKVDTSRRPVRDKTIIFPGKIFASCV